MTIRPAIPADAPALGALGAQLIRVHHTFDQQRFFAPPPDAEDGYGWFLTSQLNDEDVTVLVAEQDGTIVGYVYAGVEPHSWKELRETCGFVHDLIVAPEARGHGFGELLLEAAIAWLEGKGMPRVMLWTAEPNEAAQRLFARRGFRRTMVEMTREI